MRSEAPEAGLAGKLQIQSMVVHRLKATVAEL
jgi:hypothetical protein